MHLVNLFSLHLIVFTFFFLLKANYLCPLEWKICYNLGIVHNAMEQYASAYHFLSSAVNLNTRSTMPYMALAGSISSFRPELVITERYSNDVLK